MASLTQSSVFKALGSSGIDTNVLADSAARQPKERELEPYHLHILASKHNTHITCTKPNREPIISLSCGCLGYKKSRRSGFDSAYSLTKYVLERLIHNGWPMKIKRLEVIMRGFGQGRDAAIKVLMSPEGKVLRDKIVRLINCTICTIFPFNEQVPLAWSPLIPDNAISNLPTLQKHERHTVQS
jgi:small subunit ribosomal protein S11